MKNFLGKAFLFVLLQVCIFAWVWNPDLRHEHNYLAATIDKHHRLKSTPSPRIILIGGSNLAFGVKSDLLEHELGLPVVNMGLNAALGVSFMLREARSEIQKGDIVVLSLEYDIFSGVGVEQVLRQLLELRPPSFRYVSNDRWKRVADAYGLSILGGMARRTLVGNFKSEAAPMSGFASYRRELFDVAGSYIGHYGKPSGNPELHKVKILELSESNKALIARFARHCVDQGAICLFTCPPHPEELLTPLPVGIEHNLRELQHIPNLKVLDAPKDQMFPASAFYDTCYHLTERYAATRTIKLAEELRPFVSIANRTSSH